MPGSPVKRGNYGNWATIHSQPIQAGCGGCMHYQSDGSCDALPVLAKELGKSAYKHCKEYKPCVETATHNFVEKNCTYCLYIKSLNMYMCNQSESPRYTHECKTCEYFEVEQRENNQQILPPTCNIKVNPPISHEYKNDKAPQIHYPKNKPTDTDVTFAKGVIAKTTIPCHASFSKVEDANIVLKENIRKLETVICEYKTQINSLSENHLAAMQQKDEQIQALQQQLSEQHDVIVQLQAENDTLRSALPLIKNESFHQTEKPKSWFYKLLRHLNVKK